MSAKHFIAALGFLGLLLAAGLAGTPKAAAQACGPWNDWCRPQCGAWNNWCRSACGPWNGWCAAGVYGDPYGPPAYIPGYYEPVPAPFYGDPWPGYYGYYGGPDGGGSSVDYNGGPNGSRKHRNSGGGWNGWQGAPKGNPSVNKMPTRAAQMQPPPKMVNKAPAPPLPR